MAKSHETYRRLEIQPSDGISYHIRLIRESKGLTQKDLALSVGMCKSSFSRFEIPGYDSYTFKSLKKIASALGVDVKITFQNKDGSPLHKRRPREEILKCASTNDLE